MSTLVARLHRAWRGVYAVGRPQLTREGWWMAAVLACGEGAVLSHGTAATHWRTFSLTDSQLERRFLPIARRAGLPPPATQTIVDGYRVDFHWPDLGLAVETDGLRYHRTPQRQVQDNRRDQAHAAAGLTSLRFSHSEVAHQPHAVEVTLRRVAEPLRARP